MRKFQRRATRVLTVVCAIGLAISPAVAGDQFVAAGDMTSQRTHQGSALLADGRALQVSGLADSGVLLQSAELYDPASDSFSPTGAPGTARMRPTAVTLADGRVLVTGGRGGNQGDTIFASAELFDPASGTFSPTGDMTVARYVACAALLGNGKVLVAAGFNFTDDVLASAELYDPASGTFSATGSLSAPRDPGSRCASLHDGRVMIVGGYNNAGALATAEIYDPVSATFSPTGSLPEPRGDHALAVLDDGRVLVVGGLGNVDYLPVAQVWDPATGTFSATGSLAHPRANPIVTTLADGRVLVAGGTATGGSGDPNVAPAEIYDPASGTFSDAGDMITPRSGVFALRLQDGSVLFAGGWAGEADIPTAHAERFVPLPSVTDLVFADGFDSVQPSISHYDDLDEGFLGSAFSNNGVSYRECNGIGGVFPDGSTFEPADVGDQFIIENATMFHAEFPDFGSLPNTLTFGTSYVPGDNLSIGALVRATMDLDQPASAASVQLGYYEKGPWGGIEIHLDALDAGKVVASDMLTIAAGGDRDNPTIATLTVSAAQFDTLRLHATWNGQPSAPRVMIDDLALTPAAPAP